MSRQSQGGHSTRPLFLPLSLVEATIELEGVQPFMPKRES